MNQIKRTLISEFQISTEKKLENLLKNQKKAKKGFGWVTGITWVFWECLSELEMSFKVLMNFAGFFLFRQDFFSGESN